MTIDKDPDDFPETRQGANRFLERAGIVAVVAIPLLVAAGDKIPNYHLEPLPRLIVGLAALCFIAVAGVLVWGGIVNGRDY